ncbi:MAG: ATP-binding protein [Zavarzinella sp.]
MSTGTAVAEIAELAGGFVHEVKNHVSTLNLNLQLLAEDFAQPESPKERRAQQRINRLLNQCQRLVSISNDFLRFARAEQLYKQSTDIHSVVQEMIDFFQPTSNAAGIEIVLHASPSIPLIMVDQQLLKQALLNLMMNAEQAMPEGGEIILQTRLEDDFVVLDVIDNGKGIPSEQIPKLFQPFHTTKPGGSGLGLPTTRRIVEAHGGKILVQSEVGKGTMFSLYFPK